jgi:hypothetical protein
MNSRYRILFNVVLIGVLINILGMALPFIFAPQWTLDIVGLPGGGASTLWMRQAGLLLLFISLLYLPGGMNPVQYRWNAYFGVIVRMTIGIYWLVLFFYKGESSSFLPIGLLDCSYAIFNAFVLKWSLKKD